MSGRDPRESLPGGVFHLRREAGVWRLLYGSARFHALFGLDPGTTDGEALLARVHPEDRPALQRAAEAAARDGTTWTLELRVEHPSGGEIWVEWRAEQDPDSAGAEWHGLAQEVTTRRAARLRADLLALALDEARDSAFLLDATGHFIYANREACQELGYEADEIIGRTPLDIDPMLTPEVFAALGARTHAVRRSSVDTWHRRRDGGVFPVQVGSAALTHEGRRYTILIARDMSRQQELLQGLRAREHEFRRLAENLPDHITRIDAEGRFQYVNPALARVLGLRQEDAVGTPVTDAHRWVREAVAEVVRTRAPCAVRQAVHVDGETRIHDVRLVPELDADGKLLDVLAIGRDVTDLLEAQELISCREQEFRSLAEGAPLSIIRYDQRGRIRYLNARLARDLEVSPAEVIGKLPRDVWPDQRFGQIEDAVRNALADGRTTTVEFWAFLGGPRCHQVHVVPEHDDAGQRIGAIAFGLDVTEVRRYDQLLHALYDALPDLVWLKDPEGIYLVANRRTATRFGAAEDAVVGKRDADFLDAAEAEANAARDEAARTGGAPTVHLESVRFADGHEELLETVRVAMHDGLGLHNGVLGIARDVTERQRATLELQAAHAALGRSLMEARSLAENIPDCVMRWDRDGRCLYINPAGERLLGVSNADLAAQYDRDGRPTFANAAWHRFAATMPPEGEPTFQAALRDVIESKAPREWEMALPRPGAAEAHIEVRGVPEHHNDGSVVGVLTVARDVTHRRAAEAQQRMAASVFGAAREGIAITDPDGRILDVNPAFTRITGYTREEAVGKNPRLLASGQHDRAFYDHMWSTLRAGRSWSGEVTNRRKSGELYVEHLDIVAVPDEQGHTRHFVGIFSDISVLKEHQRHLHHIAHHDALTGLPNRLLLSDRLQQAIGQARRAGKTLAVLYLDLDGFKPVNDLHGHDVGDEVLRAVARRLTDAVRAGDTVARIGGDEFVILLVDAGTMADCEVLANRILTCVIQPIEVAELRLVLSASIGISLSPDDQADDADILLRYADQAMYAAKAAGRNQYVFHAQDASASGIGDRRMLHDLRRALADGQVWVAFQPIVDLATGRVVKAEALARWTHPEHGPVSPAEFIPIAEAGGLIQTLGDHVFARSAAVTRRWNLALGGDARRRISVNRSPRQFFHRDGVTKWLELLEQLEVRGDWLGIEITEGLLLEDRPEVVAQLDALRQAGLSVSLDDFGTGYSALSYLKKFEIDFLKIDRSFVRDVVEDPNDRAIVEAVIAMARRLRIRLIAEGVETTEQAALLRAEGCDLAQGFLFARPMPEEEFLAFVLRHN